MKKPFSMLFLLFLLTGAVMAQETEDNERTVPPPPIVSELHAVVSGDSVTLTWKAAPDIHGENIILRSNRPITAANYTATDRRGSVPTSMTTFYESIEFGKEYYYAVLTRDSEGVFYDFFLPASNSMLVAVTAESGTDQAEKAAISAFNVMLRNDAVIITWTSSPKGKNLVLYRSTSAFTGINSLVPAIVISSFKDTGTPYIDYPVPGVPYYYAILDEDDLSAGSVQFIPDQNTSRYTVEVPASFARVQRNVLPVLRPMPLPWLNPSGAIDYGAATFPAGTEKMIQNLTKNTPARKSAPMIPYIFASDKNASGSGEEFLLKGIIDATFPDGLWDKAMTDLNEFMSIRRSAAATARVHFYLGEAYYFSGKYREALLEFLLAQDQYYNQSREWIQYTLEQIVITVK
ncbi:hypothetical protein K7I13_00850 [Brucepastera parasyntrophica]|uniref:hypothetical protein n=1 Tax=Brucepastera parasyntrophica TaxID=2880008 RepID=UPI00210DB328|nr:hypothetical protein [Brucepastera parasyntrophica]ULQ59927.1 hypothetical protein K7I13_00850 [Brucepastera parasyntrophica]